MLFLILPLHTHDVDCSSYSIVAINSGILYVYNFYQCHGIRCRDYVSYVQRCPEHGEVQKKVDCDEGDWDNGIHLYLTLV